MRNESGKDSKRTLHYYIHLLGCYGNLQAEADLLKRYDVVVGMDSSWPCVFTTHGLRSREGGPRPPERQVDFLRDFYDGWLLEANLKHWWEVTCSFQVPLGL